MRYAAAVGSVAVVARLYPLRFRSLAGQLMAASELSIGGRGFYLRIRRLQRGKVSGNRSAIRIAQGFGEILHHLVAAGAGGVVAQLLLEIIGGLSGQSRYFCRGIPLAVGAVTALADRRGGGWRPLPRGLRSRRMRSDLGNDRSGSDRQNTTHPQRG